MSMRRKKTDEIKNPCSGGRSYGCRKAEHEKGREVICHRCKAVMGCIKCCENGRDLICLGCHNWATRSGVRYHGNIVPNHKIPRVHTDRGWQHYQVEESRTQQIDQIIKGKGVIQE